MTRKVTLSLFVDIAGRWHFEIVGNDVVLGAAGPYGKLNDAWHEGRRRLVALVEQGKEITALQKGES